MREELRRNGSSAGEILRAGDRRDKRAHTRADPEVPRMKKGLQSQQVRMEAEVAAVAIQKREWQKRCLRDRENASRGGVGCVSAHIVRHDDGVRIVSTEQKQANKRLVVAAIGNVGGTQPSEIEDRVEQPGRSERGASSL